MPTEIEYNTPALDITVKSDFMAYLNKNQYFRRSMNASKRNAENAAIAVENGMTEEQAELIVCLCSLRHELHTNMDAVVKDDSDIRIKRRLVEINCQIRESGLQPMAFIPSESPVADYIDIDDIFELQEMGIMEDYDDEFARIYDELVELNKNIEDYLSEIDKRYSTSFCPSGALRIM